MTRTLAMLGFFASMPAFAKITIDSGTIAVIQMSPGVHLSFEGNKFGLGASIDVRARVVFGPHDFAASLGVVAGAY